MFGSAHAGERANAAAKADELLRSHDLTWRDVLQLKKPEAKPHPAPERYSMKEVREDVAFVLRYPSLLNDWELKFLRCLREQTFMSEKQEAILDRLLNEAQHYEREAA
jgi:hypothetical protein